MRPLARGVDAALEALVVPSFTRIGPMARSRLFDWTPESELPRLDGRVAMVTGATSGIGAAAAAGLARLGATVRLLARDETKALEVRDRIRAETGNDAVDHGIADLGDLGAVAEAADEFLVDHDRLDVLVHNAGALSDERQLSVDGLELTVQTHLVAPYLLTRRLLPALEHASPGRVVWVTSGGMYSERLSVDDLVMDAAEYRGTTAYARAKRAQVALVGALGEQWDAAGVSLHVMHPGWADTPGLEKSLPGFRKVLRPVLRTADEAADTIVWLGAAEEPLRCPGTLWLDRRARSRHKLPWTRRPDEDTEARHLLAWCEEQVASVGG